MNSSQQTTLILGATGKTGRRIVERLEATGENVRLGSRTATPPFDWEDRSTWIAALDGVQAAYISFQPDLAVPGAVEDNPGIYRPGRQLRSQQVGVGCRGVVKWKRNRPEHVVQNSGVDWTILRASWFCQKLQRRAFSRTDSAG